MSEQEIAGYIVLAVLIGWFYKIFTDISKGDEDDRSNVWLNVYNRHSMQMYYVSNNNNRYLGILMEG